MKEETGCISKPGENVLVIVGSSRAQAESRRVGLAICEEYSQSTLISQISMLSFDEHSLPWWNEEKENLSHPWDRIWQPISRRLRKADAFIVICPEWGGMATPELKNFFLLCEDGELAHKPGLIVAVSAGEGGAYPISELRMSSYKNTFLLWIPEHIIIRHVEDTGDFFSCPRSGERLQYSIELLIQYSRSLHEVRDWSAKNRRWSYGM